MEKPEMENKENVATENKPAIDADALMKRLEQLESTNQRILDESKTWKSKYQGLKTDVEKKESQKLEESENWKDLLEIEKNKSHELVEQLKHFKKETLRQKIHFEVAKHASDAFDVNDVISNLPRDILSIDEENLAVKGIEESVSFVKEKKPWLFNNKKTHGQPSSRPVGENSRMSYDELSKKEKDDLFIKALSNF